MSPYLFIGTGNGLRRNVMNKITVIILSSLLALTLSSNSFASDDKHEWKRWRHQVQHTYRGHQNKRDNYQHRQHQRKHQHREHHRHSHHERNNRNYRVQRNRLIERLLIGLPGILLFHSH